MRVIPVLSLSLFVLTACGGSPESPAAAPAPPADPATLGTISGPILLDGPPPPTQMIRLDGDPKCVSLVQRKERPAEFVVMGEGHSLQNVFVYVKDGLPPRLYPVPSQPAVLDQQQCRYVPRVLGVQVGQALEIRNSDPLMHNVHANGAVNRPFNMAQPLQGVKHTRTFTTREVMVPFKCDVHSWMQAYVGVLEHPYFAVSDATGRFSIPPLPPGTYTVEAWHETLGTQTQQVTIAAKDAKTVTFTFKAS